MQTFRYAREHSSRENSFYAVGLALCAFASDRRWRLLRLLLFFLLLFFVIIFRLLHIYLVRSAASSVWCFITRLMCLRTSSMWFQQEKRIKKYIWRAFVSVASSLVLLFFFFCIHCDRWWCAYIRRTIHDGRRQNTHCIIHCALFAVCETLCNIAACIGCN